MHKHVLMNSGPKVQNFYRNPFTCQALAQPLLNLDFIPALGTVAHPMYKRVLKHHSQSNIEGVVVCLHKYLCSTIGRPTLEPRPAPPLPGTISNPVLITR